MFLCASPSLFLCVIFECAEWTCVPASAIFVSVPEGLCPCAYLWLWGFLCVWMRICLRLFFMKHVCVSHTVSGILVCFWE